MPAPKKEKKEKVTRSALKVPYNGAALVAFINEKYGAGSIIKGSDAINLKIGFISSGCAAIDIATGGGIPENRITQLVGAFSSGKTTLTIQTMVQHQKKYPDGVAALIDVENAFDLEYAQNLGLDLSRFLLIRPDSGEQAADIANDILAQDVHIILGIDSIPALVPFAEIAQSLDQNHMGKHAQLINRMVKLITVRLKRSFTDPDASTTTVLLLNQIREKIGVMFGSPDTTPGGRGKDFFAGLTLELRGGDKLEVKVVRGGVEKKVMVGRAFKMVVKKNKVGGRPFEECEYKYYVKNTDQNKFGKYNNEEVLLDQGLFYGVITLDEKTGVMTLVTKTAGTISYKSPSVFIKALKDNEKATGILYRRVMKASKEDPSDDLSGATDVVADKGGQK